MFEKREGFDREGEAGMRKVLCQEGAAAALKAGMEAGVAMRSPNAPDLNQAAKGLK